MPEDLSINTEVTGGSVGVAGAQVVQIREQTFVSNFYGSAPQSEPAKPSGPLPKSPYPGLSYFGPLDTGRFFGREQAIQALITAVTKRSFTALVGASGSGKSSVVLAGLAPRLETQGGWRSTYFRIGTEPDKNPFAALARALSPMLGDGDVVDRMTRAQKLANSLATDEISLVYVVGQCRAANPGKRILLIADQFEEVFTLVSDDGVRNRFIDALIAAFQDAALGAAPDVCLVLTLRADFVSQAINYRPLADKLKDRVEYLGVMTRDELREAIVEPAKAVGVEFEPGLANTILDDVARRPGSLPLLQFALREMWGRLKTPLMTRADYDAIGGVEGALAKRAQAIFQDATKSEMEAASVASFRRLFTRLVTLGEGAEDTRRIVSKQELGPTEWSLAQRLAGEDNRLVVTSATRAGQETAEVVHEALIPNWPTLVNWVNQDRTFQSWLRQLKPRVEEWRPDQTDDGTFLRGGPLAVAEEWVATRGNDINDEERLFVASSVSFRDAERKRANGELRKKLARLDETMTRERDRLTTMIRDRALKALEELRTHIFYLFIVVIIVSLCRSLLVIRGFNSDAPLFLPVVLTNGIVVAFAICLPVLRKYILASWDWFSRGGSLSIVFRGIFLVLPRVNKISVGNYVWVGFSSYLLLVGIYLLLDFVLNNYTIFYPFNLIFEPRLNGTSPVIHIVLLSVSLGLYSVCLDILIDAHTAGIRLTNRILDGVIVGTLIGIAEIAQSILAALLIGNFSLSFSLTIRVVLISAVCGFVIGTYVPVTASRNLVRAKSILDQCSADLRRLS